MPLFPRLLSDGLLRTPLGRAFPSVGEAKRGARDDWARNAPQLRRRAMFDGMHRGDSMMPTLHDGDIVLVDLGRRAPTPPGVFVLYDGMDWLPSGWSISPTAIRRGFASSRTTLLTSLMKAAATRSTSLAGYAGSRARCDVRARAEEENIVGRVVGAAKRLRAIR
jgi:hypothetical protein